MCGLFKFKPAVFKISAVNKSKCSDLRLLFQASSVTQPSSLTKSKRANSRANINSAAMSRSNSSTSVSGDQVVTSKETGLPHSGAPMSVSHSSDQSWDQVVEKHIQKSLADSYMKVS